MPRKNRPGVYVPGTAAGEKYQSFIPHPLPPDPPLQLTTDDYDLIEKANRALGRLDGLSSLLPNTQLFIYLYVRGKPFCLHRSKERNLHLQICCSMKMMSMGYSVPQGEYPIYKCDADAHESGKP